MKAKYSLLKVFNFTHPKEKRVMSFENWSEDEVKYLISNYQKKSIADIAHHLNRSNAKVWMKFYRLAEKGVVIRSKRKRGVRKFGGAVGWSEWEIQYLKDHYEVASWEEMKSNLNRTKGAIRMKASALGLKKRVRKTKPSRWTNARKEYVKENYKKKSVQEIADDLGVAYSTVAGIAHKLGITNPDWTQEEEEYLRENYHKYRPSYMAKELGRNVTAIYSKASKMGLTR